MDNIKVYVLSSDYFRDDMPSPIEDRKAFGDYIKKQEDTEVYSLKDFELAFNDEHISDLSYIYIELD